MYAAAYANWFVHVTYRLVVRNRDPRVRRNHLLARRRRWGSRSLRATYQKFKLITALQPFSVWVIVAVPKCVVLA